MILFGVQNFQFGPFLIFSFLLKTENMISQLINRENPILINSEQRINSEMESNSYLDKLNIFGNKFLGMVPEQDNFVGNISFKCTCDIKESNELLKTFSEKDFLTTNSISPSAFDLRLFWIYLFPNELFSNSESNSIQDKFYKIFSEYKNDLTRNYNLTKLKDDNISFSQLTDTKYDGIEVKSEAVKKQYFDSIEKREEEWTEEMRVEFLDLFKKHGRNFRLIAQEMNINTYQAITFYYDFKYSPEFREVIDLIKKGSHTNVSYMRSRNKRKNKIDQDSNRETRGKKKRELTEVKDNSIRRPRPISRRSPPIEIDNVVDKIIAIREFSGESEEILKYENQMSSSYSFLKKIRFLVKWKERSYLHTDWIPVHVLLQQHMGGKKVQRFLNEYDLNSFKAMHKDFHYFPNDFKTIERILYVDNEKDLYFVKWKSLDYSECTFEKFEVLQINCPEFNDKLKEFYERENKHLEKNNFSTNPCLLFKEEPKYYFHLIYSKILRTHDSNLFEFPDTIQKHQIVRFDDRLVYDYELDMLNWLITVRKGKRSGAMLTSLVDPDKDSFHRSFATVEFLKYLNIQENMKGPHLIVCSLKHVENWLQELRTELPDMNTVCFYGNHQSRETAYNYEFWNEGDDPIPKVDILLTTFEVCLAHKDLIKDFYFQVAVIDGGHRMRKIGSKLRECIVDLNPAFRLVLTSNPPRSDPREWFSLLNLIDSVEFEDEDSFLETYKDIDDLENLQKDEKLSKYFCILKEDDFQLSEDKILNNPLDDDLLYDEITPTPGKSKSLYNQFMEITTGISQKPKTEKLDKKRKRETNASRSTKRRKSDDDSIEDDEIERSRKATSMNKSKKSFDFKNDNEINLLKKDENATSTFISSIHSLSTNTWPNNNIQQNGILQSQHEVKQTKVSQSNSNFEKNNDTHSRHLSSNSIIQPTHPMFDTMHNQHQLPHLSSQNAIKRPNSYSNYNSNYNSNFNSNHQQIHIHNQQYQPHITSQNMKLQQNIQGHSSHPSNYLQHNLSQANQTLYVERQIPFGRVENQTSYPYNYNQVSEDSKMIHNNYTYYRDQNPSYISRQPIHQIHPTQQVHTITPSPQIRPKKDLPSVQDLIKKRF